MMQAIRRLFTAETAKNDWCVACSSLVQEKRALRVKLLAVAIARTSDYADPTRWSRPDEQR
jgi:hypothetical protein